MIELRAYSDVYLNDVVENQGKLFGFISQKYPQKDTADFIHAYMVSKTRKSIDEAQAYVNTMNDNDLWDYFEKTDKYEENDQIFSISNLCLMGTSVISGSATALVINTGFETYLGGMGKQVDNKKEITNFQKGMDGITKLLIRYMVVVSIAVFIIYAFIRKDFMEAMLFALSVAVGITPTMLPMIVNVNLTKGTKTLAKKKTLVKNTEAIQNLGAIDVLCTDKTGTLTMDKIVLQKYIDVTGKEDLSILEYAYLNSYYGTGMKNLVDRAIVSYGDEHDIKNKIESYVKVDEIPFDYTRKRMSVVVEQKNGSHRMITKGALEEIIKICTKVKVDNKIQEITEEMKNQIKWRNKECK